MTAWRTLAFATTLALSACATAPVLPAQQVSAATETAAIQAVLDMQSEAWNRGDVDTFMEGYWKSPELRFASGGSVTYGWQETMDGYKTRYDSAAKMGKLSFTELIIEETGPQDALAFGRWTLQREADTPGGLFTLHFHKFDGQWLIVADHTSSNR